MAAATAVILGQGTQNVKTDLGIKDRHEARTVNTKALDLIKPINSECAKLSDSFPARLRESAVVQVFHGVPLFCVLSNQLLREGG